MRCDAKPDRGRRQAGDEAIARHRQRRRARQPCPGQHEPERHSRMTRRLAGCDNPAELRGTAGPEPGMDAEQRRPSPA
jgi:hypothetical protein